MMPYSALGFRHWTSDFGHQTFLMENLRDLLVHSSFCLSLDCLCLMAISAFQAEV
jgi:hypothetical protein